MAESIYQYTRFVSAVAILVWLTASVARADVLYITTGNEVAKITPDGIVSPFVIATGDGPTGNHINNAIGITADQAGILYVSSQNNNDIVRIAPDASTSIYGTFSGQFNQSLAMDHASNLYVGKFTSNYILKVAPDGTQSAVASLSNHPEDVAVDNVGNVYSSTLDNTVVKITSGGIVSTLATGLNGPTGLSVDANGNVFVAIYGDNAIDKITPTGDMSTFASGLSGPFGITFDSAGNLFVINTNSISEVTPVGAVSTFVSGQGGFFITAISVPEPSTFGFVVTVGICLLHRCRRLKSFNDRVIGRP